MHLVQMYMPSYFKHIIISSEQFKSGLRLGLLTGGASENLVQAALNKLLDLID